MSNLVPSLGISLIITSRDRQTDLDRFVNAVSQQTFPGQIEILFVAQGQAQLNLRNPGRGNVKVIVHDHGAWLGLSKARNLGLKECTGDVIGFPDDDCWYEPDFLRKLAAYFEEHPEVDCVCTNVFDPERKVSLGRRPVGITRKVSFRNLFRFPISVGIFVRRESFLKIGGRFNELLGAGSSMGSGEETELVARMLAYSMRVEYVGDLQVYHAVPRPASSDISKHYRYSIGFGSLHGYLTRNGHWSVLVHLAGVMLRSTIAVLISVGRPASRGIYWSRLCGITRGFARGLFNPRPFEI